MIAVTGATGQLGKLVVEDLLKRVPAAQIVAAVRTPAKAASLQSLGVDVREADFDKPETLRAAFEGVEKLLLISGNEVGKRVAQHSAAIDAAKAAGVTLIAYTSILRADTSKLLLAEEHKATEAYLRASGVPFVFLRNGWYTENLTAGIPPAIEHGALIGCAGEGRFAAASRADFAQAAAAVLAGGDHTNRVYELAGDTSFTLGELADEVSRQTGNAVRYSDVTQAEFEKILGSFLPAPLPLMIADAQTRSKDGELEDASGTLSRLSGRATISLEAAVKEVLPTATR